MSSLDVLGNLLATTLWDVVTLTQVVWNSNPLADKLLCARQDAALALRIHFIYFKVLLNN